MLLGTERGSKVGLLASAKSISSRALTKALVCKRAGDGLRTAVTAKRSFGRSERLLEKRTSIIVDARNIADQRDRAHTSDVVVSSCFNTVRAASGVATADDTLDLLKTTSLDRALADTSNILCNNGTSSIATAERRLSKGKNVARDRSLVRAKGEGTAMTIARATARQTFVANDNRGAAVSNTSLTVAETGMRSTGSDMAASVHNNNRSSALVLNNSSAANWLFFAIVRDTSTLMTVKADTSEFTAVVTTVDSTVVATADAVSQKRGFNLLESDNLLDLLFLLLFYLFLFFLLFFGLLLDFFFFSFFFFLLLDLFGLFFNLDLLFDLFFGLFLNSNLFGFLNLKLCDRSMTEVSRTTCKLVALRSISVDGLIVSELSLQERSLRNTVAGTVKRSLRGAIATLRSTIGSLRGTVV